MALIFVTVLGIVTFVRYVLSSNAFCAIVVTVYPPRVDGIESVDAVPEYAVIVAFEPDTVYV